MCVMCILMVMRIEARDIQAFYRFGFCLHCTSVRIQQYGGNKADRITFFFFSINVRRIQIEDILSACKHENDW